MNIVTQILATLVAIEFFYIFYLETIIPTSLKTGQVFNILNVDANRPIVQTLFKNQGVYNGLIGLCILYATFISSNGQEILCMLLIYIIIVAVYGGLTSNKKIILMQGGLPIITLISMLF